MIKFIKERILEMRTIKIILFSLLLIWSSFSGLYKVEASTNYNYVSASSVAELNRDLSSISPEIAHPDWLKDYLYSWSCLGYYGPIGPYGPLGMLGPVGSNIWNPSVYISGIGDWSYWSETLTNLGGPLSEDGPLGPTGPLNENAYFHVLPAINDFGKHLQAGGLFTVLGPVGPLGALGPLGPLGPIGAHGYLADSNGNYVSNGVIYRTVGVPYNDTIRTYELFEKYTESHAKSMTDNDTSFMVEGEIYPLSENDTYTFTSNESQFVTILVTPEKEYDDFDLEILDSNDNVIATSNRADYIDWVQIQVPAGTTLKARVTLHSTGHFLSKTYRLFVVGSTQYINTTDISGNHVKTTTIN